MANYYCLMAGMPDIAMDEGDKCPVTLEDFREQCDEVLTEKDKGLLYYFYLKQDCLNVVRLLKASKTNEPTEDLSALGVELNPWCNYTMEQYQDLISAARTMNFNVHRYPSFISAFARDYNYNKEKEGWFAEDQMLLAYYDYAQGCPNRMISAWFKLNFNVTNIMTALIARKYGWNVSNFILGDNEVNEMIRTNNTKDFSLINELDYMVDIMKIVDTEDPVEKEKRIDAFKWNWLDEQTFMNIFSVEAVFAYLCKLEMLNRWEQLDPEKGKEAFRRVIENLRGEAKVPEEFVRPDIAARMKRN